LAEEISEWWPRSTAEGGINECGAGFCLEMAFSCLLGKIGSQNVTFEKLGHVPCPLASSDTGLIAIYALRDYDFP